MSSSVNLEDFRIPLEELTRATNNFDSRRIEYGGYIGKLSQRWQNRTAFIKRYNKEEYKFHELQIVSRLHNEHIISFIGYCDEDENYIYTAYEYFIHESLDESLLPDIDVSIVGWPDRLKICIMVAKVLNYLHSGVGELGRVIHGDVKCENILCGFDDNFQLMNIIDIKVCGFKHSKLVPLDQPHQHHSCPEELFKKSHADPIYKETNLLNAESDVYSFGVLMFEVLHGTGSQSDDGDRDENLRQLMNQVWGCYDDGPYNLVDPNLRGTFSHRSLQIFATLAYKCISSDIKERPRMGEIIKTIEKALDVQGKGIREFWKEEQDTHTTHGAASTTARKNQNLEDFRIPLRVIKFGEKVGYGGFGNVYKGQTSDHWQNRTVAIKCLRSDNRQGEQDFRNELNMIFKFNHENIIPFIGYCDEGKEKIIVYEYASNGSLDCHLEDEKKRRFLTWEHRLKICLGAAKGIEYLHSGLGEGNRVIHRDVKSGNILLDHNFVAKVCDFGLSKSGPINQPHTQVSQVYTNAAGTNFYMDPVYHESGILQKESDVYSFGVVMFELLSGKLAYNQIPLEGGEPKLLINIVRRYYDYNPYLIIDPLIRDEIYGRSLHTFKDVAYKCISFNKQDRPSMNQVVKRLEEALYIHNNEGNAFTNLRTIEKFEIPLEEIRKSIGAEDFDRRISSKPHSMMTARGKLVDLCNDIEVFFKHWTSVWYVESMFTRIRNELLLISSFDHENITPFIGCYRSDDNVIIASEYALNGSLYSKLETQCENSYLTWAERLKICLGAARGLKYFHAGFGEHKVIHGDFKSEKILLYYNLEAKICGFGKSFLVPRSYPDNNIYKEAQGSKYYMDPIYRESCIPRVESNVYSFGVVLFEVLTGVLACNHPIEDERISMINWVRRYNDEIDKLIDYRIRDEIDARSLHTFKDVAYKCISFNMKDRPSMNQVVKRLEEALYIQTHRASTIATKNQNLEDFQIPLEDINLAIGVKGQETRIGDGGFGFVYKGQLSERWQNRTVAIKRLRPDSYQGEYEFRNELNMIFSFSHENIIPFIGYCAEGKEKIIVYDYPSNGSLDRHLENKEKRRFLTWEHRLKICLGAAKGLNYLHSGLGEEHRVIHRDVKSGNILLDHNFVAKVCDFGLSKSGAINQQHTQVYTNAAGTNFYMDPVYHEGGILRKESDVYSFGVVMFELLSGMLAYHRRSLEGGKQKPLINLVRRYYDYKPELIIDPLIRNEIDNSSFNAYREIAFQCISFNSKKRPTMEMIVERVEEALELQVTNQGILSKR